MWKVSLIILVAAAVMPGCGRAPPQSGAQREGEPRQKVAIACTYQPQSTLVHVAEARGPFAEAG